MNNLIPIIIPCRNEIENLKILIYLFKKFETTLRPILVDNGSTDGSRSFAIKNGWETVFEPKPGYGSACKKGIQYILKKYPSNKIIGFFDADISENPKDLLVLHKVMKQYDLDLIIGSRHKYFHQMPAKIRLANKLFGKIIQYLYRFPIADNGPMRLIKMQSLIDLQMGDDLYGWTFEMTIKALKTYKKIGIIPVHHYVRYSGKSKISGNLINSFRSLVQILFILIKYL